MPSIREEAQEAIEELKRAQESLVQSRDALNLRLQVFRTTVARLERQLEILENVQDPDNLQLLEEATRSMAEFARRALTPHPAQIAVLSTNGGATPTRTPHSRRRGARGSTPTPSSGRRRSRTRSQVWDISPIASKILRAGLSAQPLPLSLPELLETAYGPNWSQNPVPHPAGGGRILMMPLAEEIAQPASSTLKSLSNAVRRARLFLDDQVPEGHTATARIRYLAEQIRGRHEEVEQALGSWGINENERH